MSRPAVTTPFRAAAVMAVAVGLAAPTTPATAGDSDVPGGAPAAARRDEPTLPQADGWPFAEHWSRTSGTGRLHDGASYWSDFLYDDHGAAAPTGFNTPGPADLAPEQGVYEYPAGPARGNGADIFRAATGVDADRTYWRVDWNTLADADVPIAVWTFDTDADDSTGQSSWPAGAGVSSPGIEKALIVSSKGAWLEDLATGDKRSVTSAGGAVHVDKAARSFVVAVPRRLLPVDGSWTVRLAAGLADDTGQAMAAPQSASGLPVPPGLTHVYNVTFRRVRQEPPVFRDGMTDALVAAFQATAASTPPFDQIGADGLARFVTGNFWMEDNQADTLTSGDVSKFAETIDWSRLTARENTREPRPTGYSNRWYVSPLHLGQGVVADNPGAGDLEPNFLSRVQSYAVYVPRSVPRDQSMPLTWVLHSLGVNHNQYGALDPRLLQQLCEQRSSICATTNGYGPDGWYFDEAENDYWSVWRELGQAYHLDPRRTVISGYSMGGYATYKLGLAHPDLYAAAVTLAGPPQCGVTLDGGQVGGSAGSGRCSTDSATGPLVGNARWVPYRIGQGTADELVPFTSVEAQVNRFDMQGLRHLFVRYPGEDHLVFATQDRFDSAVDGLGRPTVRRNPDRIDFRWYPHLTRPGLGIGATTAYWVSGLQARSDAASTLASVHARSLAVSRRRIGVVRAGPTPITAPLLAVATTVGWKLGDPVPTRRVLRLRLSDVGALRVNMERASLPCGTVRVRTDGPTRLTLTQLATGSRVFGLDRGPHVLHLRCG